MLKYWAFFKKKKISFGSADDMEENASRAAQRWQPAGLAESPASCRVASDGKSLKLTGH
jgi:hypothetical protein